MGHVDARILALLLGLRFVATSSRLFSKAAREALMSELSSFASVCIRLIIAKSWWLIVES